MCGSTVATFTITCLICNALDYTTTSNIVDRLCVASFLSLCGYCDLINILTDRIAGKLSAPRNMVVLVVVAVALVAVIRDHLVTQKGLLPLLT